MRNFGFVQSKGDPTLYVWNLEKAFEVIVVYVKNIELYEDKNLSSNWVEKHFKNVTEICVDGKTERFLGFSV